jgi:ribosome-associated toxin RatA of RatAB toxin-antitoxin module
LALLNFREGTLKKIHKTALVRYQAIQMYNLVDDINSYADFLPWCSKSTVLTRSADSVDASLEINYGKLHKSFTTRNFNTPHQAIEMTLLDGPFRHLHGKWTFTPLGDEGARVELTLEFEFSSKLLDMTVGPVFSHIANSLVDAFTKRAQEVYA